MTTLCVVHKCALLYSWVFTVHILARQRVFAGEHFVGDVVSTHTGEKYIYSGQSQTHKKHHNE